MLKFVGAFTLIFLLGIAFFIGTQKPNTAAIFAAPQTSSSSKASAVASAAYAKCVQNGGFVTTNRRGSWGFYNECNFADDMTCELYALYEDQCPIGGVHTVGYSTRPQVFCALRGGTPQGKNNGQCKLPNGTVCSTDQVYKDTCSTN